MMAAPPKEPRFDNAKAAIDGFKPFLQRGAPFHPEKDIPSLAGKVILVTGGAGGIGRATVRELARHGPPAQIWIADFKPDAAAEVIAEIQKENPQAVVRFLELDLGDFDKVRAAAQSFLSQTDRLDVLMLNAGMMTTRPGTSASGYEVMFGVNFMGHALLTRLLLPRLLQTAAARLPSAAEGESESGAVRIVATGSSGHGMAPKPDGILFDRLRDPTGGDLTTYNRYGQSKLAMLLWARRLAREHPSITVVVVHPGNVQTGLAAALAAEKKKENTASVSQRLFAPGKPLAGLLGIMGIKTPEKGCLNQLWAATAPEGVVSGKYYCPVGVPDRELGLARRGPEADRLEARLWDWLQGELDGAEKTKKEEGGGAAEVEGEGSQTATTAAATTTNGVEGAGGTAEQAGTAAKQETPIAETK